VTEHRQLRHWLDDVAGLAAVLRTRFGVRLIVFSGLPPMHAFPAFPQPLRWYLGRRARLYDAALARWVASQRDCEHVELMLPAGADLFAVDGMHPGPKSYQLWGTELATRIRAHRNDSGLAFDDLTS
jgi:hypothetical protein